MTTEKKSYYIYKHTCLANNKSYIGISCQKPEDRWRSGLGYKDQSKFFGAIKKYGWNGFKHEILYKNLSQKDAYRLEMDLIKKYNSIHNGYNIQQGGEDVGIWAIDHLSVPVYKLDPIDLHIVDSYDSLSVASRELSTSPTAISKAIQTHGLCDSYYWCKSDNYSKEWKKRINKNEERVLKIDSKQFNVIKEYNSIHSASKETGISKSALYRCHEFFSLGGFCWCKKKDWYKGWKPSKRPDTSTPVYQIDIKTLKVINEWKSIRLASQVLKISESSISSSCLGKRITGHGYLWCKIEDWNPNWKPRQPKVRKTRAKEIYQIDKNTLKVIKIYKSAREAGRALGVPNTCIAKVASGSATESGGYYWCYSDRYNNWKPKDKKKTGPSSKKIGQYDKNLELIKKWDSTREASKILGISESNIRNALRNVSKTANGCFWKYLN